MENVRQWLVNIGHDEPGQKVPPPATGAVQGRLGLVAISAEAVPKQACYGDGAKAEQERQHTPDRDDWLHAVCPLQVGPDSRAPTSCQDAGAGELERPCIVCTAHLDTTPRTCAWEGPTQV